ncbi:MAG TPA: type II toxin-antitoxin system prevent-host-death family antitoxin [Aeromicrobium sp.]|nr:type II toxin-antitoxin system prevent-host-death family antitoxin [Aeromicrobium sp.]
MESIGVRELRQAASKFLRRVEGGESLVITSHGQPVALLVPINGLGRTSQGQPIEYQSPGHGSILDLEPLDAPTGTPSNQEILENLRAERIE